MSDSILGNETYAFGPGNLYWDTAVGGDNVFLGECDSAVINAQMTKLDLKTAQKGDRAADKAVSSQNTMVTYGMAQATIERLALVLQGFTIQYDIATGLIPLRFFMSDVIGQRDSAVAKQMTFIEIVDGQESADEFRIMDIWKASPLIESSELTFDATTQRYFPLQFEAYLGDDPVEHVDPSGKYTYWASREKVEP